MYLGMQNRCCYTAVALHCVLKRRIVTGLIRGLVELLRKIVFPFGCNCKLKNCSLKSCKLAPAGHSFFASNRISCRNNRRTTMAMGRCAVDCAWGEEPIAAFRFHRNGMMGDLTFFFRSIRARPIFLRTNYIVWIHSALIREFPTTRPSTCNGPSKRTGVTDDSHYRHAEAHRSRSFGGR